MSGPGNPPFLFVVKNEQPRKLDADGLLKWLRESGVPGAAKISANQVKIGRLNFYISTGVLNFDNEPRLPVRGLSGLRSTLEQALKRTLPDFD
jgi:hypothetical protein